MLGIDDLVIRLLPQGVVVSKVDDLSEVREWIPAMLGYARRHKTYLTGPEVGLPKRIIVSFIPEDVPRIFINPTLVGYGETLRPTRHREVSIHAINLKEEQFFVDTTSGYFSVVSHIAPVFADQMQEAYEILESYPSD